MILVEGPRNVGKTFLIESTCKKSFKISFVEDFLKKFPGNPWERIDGYSEIHEKKEIFNFGYAVGKDISLMKANQAGLLPVDIIVDRSFLTTCAYSRLFKRVPDELIQKHFDNIIKDFILPDKFKSILIVIIIGENPVSRMKDDFDFVDYEKELEAFREFSKMLPGSYVLENEFNEDSIKRFHEIVDDATQRMKT